MTQLASRLLIAIPALLVALAVLMFISLGAIMYFFMGGDDASPIGSALRMVQWVGAIGGIALVLASVWFFLARDGSGWKGLYDYTPRWLIAFVLMVYAIFAVGELSFIVLSRYISTAGNSALHVSLTCLLVAPTALAMLVAVWRKMSGGPPFTKARW